MVAVLVATALTGAAGCAGSSAGPGQRTPSATALPTAHRSTSGTDPVAAAIEADFDHYTTDDKIRAVVVTVDGHTRFEHYYGGATPEETRSVFSVTKSVMSTLIGQAVAEHRLRLDDHLSTLLPRYAAQMPARVARVTLRQLLTMTGGFPDSAGFLVDDEMVRSKDWVRFVLTHQDRAPGVGFAYSDPGAHLLSPILEQATGQSVLAYARTHLFGPLDIPTQPAAQPVPLGAGLGELERAGFAWATDPQGHALGFTHLKITPRDMARFGQLFLDGGRWHGRQVVPTEWVREATTPQAGNPDYGYLWWLIRADGLPSFAAEGFGGQLVAVVPGRRLVIVVSSYVDLETYEPFVGDDDLQRLADAITRAVAAPRSP